MGGHAGKRDLAVTFYKRRHGDVMGWQWCLLTYTVCIATGWTECRREARREAAEARRQYLCHQGAGMGVCAGFGS